MLKKDLIWLWNDREEKKQKNKKNNQVIVIEKSLFLDFRLKKITKKNKKNKELNNFEHFFFFGFNKMCCIGKNKRLVLFPREIIR